MESARFASQLNVLISGLESELGMATKMMSLYIAIVSDRTASS